MTKIMGNTTYELTADIVVLSFLAFGIVLLIMALLKAFRE